MRYKVIEKEEINRQSYFAMPGGALQPTVDATRYKYKLEPVDPQHPTRYAYLETDESMPLGLELELAPQPVSAPVADESAPSEPDDESPMYPSERKK